MKISNKFWVLCFSYRKTLLWKVEVSTNALIIIDYIARF